MSYAYTLDEAANLLVVKFWGSVPYSEEAEAVSTVLDDPRIRRGVRILVDRTDSALASSPQEVRGHANLVMDKIESLRVPRVANVVSSDHDYGSIRMFQLSAEAHLDHEFSVFRDVAEACDWLGVNQEDVIWPQRQESVASE